MEREFTMELLTPESEYWLETIAFARDASWSAGPLLANDMERGAFSGWERVLIARDADGIAGFCTAARTDCIPDVPYTPYIGYVFVDERRRGHRLSQRMLECAMDYLRTLGFERVYLVSDHDGLYEKYGFKVIDRKLDVGGSPEKIYLHEL